MWVLASWLCVKLKKVFEEANVEFTYSLLIKVIYWYTYISTNKKDSHNPTFITALNQFN